MLAQTKLKLEKQPQRIGTSGFHFFKNEGFILQDNRFKSIKNNKISMKCTKSYSTCFNSTKKYLYI